MTDSFPIGTVVSVPDSSVTSLDQHSYQSWSRPSESITLYLEIVETSPNGLFKLRSVEYPDRFYSTRYTSNFKKASLWVPQFAVGETVLRDGKHSVVITAVYPKYNGVVYDFTVNGQPKQGYYQHLFTKATNTTKPDTVSSMTALVDDLQSKLTIAQRKLALMQELESLN